jgi:cell division protein FtsB
VNNKVDKETFERYCSDNDYKNRAQEQVNKELLRTINDLNANVKEMNAHIEWLKKNNR